MATGAPAVSTEPGWVGELIMGPLYSLMARGVGRTSAEMK